MKTINFFSACKKVLKLFKSQWTWTPTGKLWITKDLCIVNILYNFELVEIDVVCAQSNRLTDIEGCTTFIIHKDDVEFVFIAETFNQDLQK